MPDMFIRVLSAVIFSVGLLLMTADTLLFSVGRFESTVLYRLLAISDLTQTPSWQAWYIWVTPTVVGAIGLIVPLAIRRFRR